jgi:hypothetical protein
MWIRLAYVTFNHAAEVKAAKAGTYSADDIRIDPAEDLDGQGQFVKAVIQMHLEQGLTLDRLRLQQVSGSSWASGLVFLGVRVGCLGCPNWFFWVSELVVLGFRVGSLGRPHWFSWVSELIFPGVRVGSTWCPSWFSWVSELVLPGVRVGSPRCPSRYSWFAQSRFSCFLS